MKHTPGPWLAVDVSGDALDSSDPLFGVIADRQPIGAVYNDICTVWKRGGFKKTAANAKLIAAAPELLEALKLLHNNLAEYQRINNLGGYDNHDMKMARAAIAKAES